MSGALPVMLLMALLAVIVVVGLWLVLSGLTNWFLGRRARARKSDSTLTTPTLSHSNAGPILLCLKEPEHGRWPTLSAWKRLVSCVRKNVFGQPHGGITVKVKNAKLGANLSFSIAKDSLDESANLKVAAIVCPLCRCTIYSRARHDFRSCSCGAVSIDGGFDYMKGSFDPARTRTMPKRIEILVPATKKELYDDYNTSRDRFGLIEPERPATARTERPRTRRAATADRKPAASRRKNTRVRK